MELQNDLLGLFVDIPVSISKSHGKGGRSLREAELLHSLWMRLNQIDDGLDPSRAWAEIAGDGEPVTRLEYPTSDLLLDFEFQERMPLTVLEGAPGQGKSTITQYVCQVHRMRLLDLQPERLPERHRACPCGCPSASTCATWRGGSRGRTRSTRSGRCRRAIRRASRASWRPASSSARAGSPSMSPICSRCSR